MSIVLEELPLQDRDVCRTNPTNPSLTLLKSICYPLNVLFKSKITEWGIKNEPNAREEYFTYQQGIHEQFSCKTTGLIISPTLPYLPASPDGLVSCTCCGNGVLEVKCPYTSRNCSLEDYISLPTSCLEYDNNNIRLKRNHSYYYQVQMRVSKTEYCDFVVWSPGEFFLERVAYSEDFWSNVFPLVEHFHKSVVLPELLGRFFFTKNCGVIETWCVCDEVDDGRPMIKCENDTCEIKWFHTDCVGLLETPTNIW